MTQVLTPHGKFFGAIAVAVLSPTRIGLACAERRRIVTQDRVTARYAGESADLGAEPGCLLLFSGAPWTVLSNGNVLKLSNAAAPAVTATISAHAATNRWITSYGNVIIAPGRVGGLVTISTTGTVLFTLDSILPSIQVAVASGGYVYCIDPHGHGYVISVDGTSGAMSKTAEFDATDCQDPVDAFISGTDLIVASSVRAAVVTFSLSAPAAPAVSSRVTLDGDAANALLRNDPSQRLLTDQEVASLNVSEWNPATAGVYVDTVTRFIAQGRSGRIVTNFTPPVWAKFNPLDKSASSTLSSGDMTVQVTNGYARLDTANSAGKRQIDIRYLGGGARPVVSLCSLTGSPNPNGDANVWTYDGTGYFGHLGWDGGGHVGIGTVGDILSLAWDADVGTVAFYKNGVVIAGQPAWAGILGALSISITPSTLVSQCSVDIITDPSLFPFPIVDYTGFSH